MKLHLDKPGGINMFTAYGDGFVAINNEQHRENVILLPEQIISGWTAATSTTLTPDDMAKLMALGTEIVLLGTGERIRFPSGELLRPFPAAGIGLEVMDAKAACRTYNILAAEGRKVAAAILLA